MKLSLFSSKWLKVILLLVLLTIPSFFIFRYFNIPDHTNLILITIDTLRADHLACYGYKENTSPFLNELAQEGTIFLNAYVQIPLTLPSHTAILTSTYPRTNGVRLNGYCQAKEELITLAEVLKKKNYSTFAVIGGFPLDGRFGLSQGFDIYDDKLEGNQKRDVRFWHSHKFIRYERKAHEVTNRSIEILSKVGRKEKFFLWLHYFDPHWRYNPPEKFRELFDLAYDGEIAYVDSEIERFYKKLKKQRFDKNTIIVIASDHGEGLNEHEEEGHGWELFNTTLRIPIILYYPDILPRNTKIDTLCQSIDILPTVLELMGIPSPAGIEGQSLANLINRKGEKATSGFVFAESNKPRVIYGNNSRYCLIDGSFKLIAYYDADHQAVEYKLFNLKEDPKELKDIASSHPEVVEKLATEISNFFGPAVENYAFFRVNKEIEEKLRALGYVD